MNEDTRPFFSDIWIQRKFNLFVLARVACVDVRLVLRMMRGWPIAREQAIQVLDGLSILLRQAFSLDTVRVVLKDRA